MQDRIADELDRSDLTTQIQRAIKSAVAYYEKKRLFFNEQRTLTFPTVTGQEFYTSSDNSNIPNLLMIDVAKIAISDSNKYELERKPYTELEIISEGITADQAQPSWFAYYGKQIRLYPIPDASYSVVFSGIFSLGDLSATADTNAWMTDGEALIRARAKYELLTHVIKDVESAQLMKAAEHDEFEALQEATSSRKATGKLTPTEF
jgi:hypothetical protein